jgi:hypothetical protein
MTQSRLPDPRTSRAVLFGAAKFPLAPQLPSIPAVTNNLNALTHLLTNPGTGVLPGEHCLQASESASVADVGDVLSAAAAEASDVLLVYYTGHGVLDDRGRLHFAVADTRAARVGFSAVSMDAVREALADSPAVIRVLILDCCFSGRAFEAMAGPDGLVGGQVDVAGTYTITATARNTPALAPEGQRYSAFTGALLEAFNRPQVSTLDQIYTDIDRELARRGLPRPQRRVVNAAGDLVMALGPISQPLPAVTSPAKAAGTLLPLDSRSPRRRIEVPIPKITSERSDARAQPSTAQNRSQDQRGNYQGSKIYKITGLNDGTDNAPMIVESEPTKPQKRMKWQMKGFWVMLAFLGILGVFGMIGGNLRAAWDPLVQLVREHSNDSGGANVLIVIPALLVVLVGAGAVCVAFRDVVPSSAGGTVRVVVLLIGLTVGGFCIFFAFSGGAVIVSSWIPPVPALWISVLAVSVLVAIAVGWHNEAGRGQ